MTAATDSSFRRNPVYRLTRAVFRSIIQIPAVNAAVGRLDLRPRLARTLDELERRYLRDVARVRSALTARQSPPPRLTMALLTVRLQRGYGVDVVVAEFVEYFVGRGYRVVVLYMDKDDSYDHRFQAFLDRGSLELIRVRSHEEAEAVLRRIRPDFAVPHTPPFFEVLPHLREECFSVLFDYGEPPAELFPADREHRERIRARKIEVARRADAVFGISDFITRDSGLGGALPCWLGNDHLLKRRSNLAELAGTFRRRLNVEDEFIVLNVTRFLAPERAYKGVDAYAEVARAFRERHPEAAAKVRFVIAGRAEADDERWASEVGLHPVSNLSDDALLGAYLDVDFYLSTSQWEGYNLGIGQALALGLDAAASDRGAHAEFRIPVSNDPAVLADTIFEAFQRRGPTAQANAWRRRLAKSEPRSWRDVLANFEQRVLTLRSLRKPDRDPVTRELLATRKSEVDQLLRRPVDRPEISFLILNKDKPELLVPCIRSIEKQCNVPYEILIGDTGSTSPEVIAFYQSTPHRVFHLGFYNFSACNNLLAAKARGRFLALVNNDTELIESDFRSALAYMEGNPRVGTLGAYLLYKDRTIQHAGVRICPHQPYRGVPEHIDKHKPIEGYPGLATPREVVCVTGAYLIVSAEKYRQLGGLDEVYREEAQDADLCLKLFEQGFANVVHPAILAFHYENATRTVKESPHDRDVLFGRYGALIENKIYDWQASRGLA